MKRKRISPFDDDFGVFADEVVLAEDEQRPVALALLPQPADQPTPSVLRRRRRHGRDPRHGRVGPGDEGGPRPGRVDAAAAAASAAVAHPGRRYRRPSDNNIHHRSR